MFQKIFNYANKILFQYIILVIITFILTILFFKNQEPILLNLSPPNNINSIEKLIDQYLLSTNKKDKRTISKKLLTKGSFLLNPLFNRMQQDKAHKTEYIEILEQLKIINNCKEYNLDCYLEKWFKIKEKYSQKHINFLLRKWVLDSKTRKETEIKLKNIGKFATPYILNFIIQYNTLNYDTSKPLYKLINNIKEKPIFKEKSFKHKDLIIEYFKYFHTRYHYYYQEFTISNQIKTIFTDTQFANWIISAFSFNFGTINKTSIYEVLSILFLRTLIITLFAIIFSYYFIIIVILKIKIKSNLFYKIIDKSLYLLSLIPSLMLIVFFTLFTHIFDLSNKEKLFQYIILLFIITILIIFRSIESIIIREKNKKEINALGFYGIKESIIFKKYVYKNINIFLLKKIKTLIIPIISYVIVLEYLLNFNGLGKLFLNSLIKQNFNILRIDILFIGIMILVTKIFIDFMIFINLKEISQYETNN